MNDYLCLANEIRLVVERLDQPGVLLGRQRSPAFKSKVIRAAAFILRWHRRSVRKLARLGEAHRFPFTRRAVARLCGVDSYALQRVIKILEAIGVLAGRSALSRWCEGNTRSMSPGAESYWYKPSQFEIGSDFANVIVDGTEIAASTLENQCDPDEIPNVSRMNLNLGKHQPERKGEEIQVPFLRSASNPAIPTGLDDDAVNPGLEAALERLRSAAVSSAMPDDRRAPAPSPDDQLADLEVGKGTLMGGLKLTFASALSRR